MPVKTIAWWRWRGAFSYSVGSKKVVDGRTGMVVLVIAAGLVAAVKGGAGKDGRGGQGCCGEGVAIWAAIMAMWWAVLMAVVSADGNGDALEETKCLICNFMGS